ncbi:alpha/beta hydrolase family protein [Bradyrhizobium sp. RDT10]
MPALLSIRFALGLASLVVSALPLHAQTMIAPPRTLNELKEETLARVERGGYPAMGLNVEDAREALSHINSLDRDEWAVAWSAIGDRYRATAHQAQGPAAREAYYKAFQYYSMARFPTPNSPGKRAAYDRAVAAYLDYAGFDLPRLEVVRIPFEGKEIVGYLRLPDGRRPAPLMIMWGGLDFLKEQAADNLLPIVRGDGFAAFAVDMPGTGQAPIKVGPTAERMYSAIIDHMRTRPEIDAGKIFVWGASWGGYWATKVAVVEKDRIAGAINQGGPIDVYFRPEWQMKALGTREYLMDLLAARAAIYDNVNTLEEFLAAGPKMSLLAMGILDRPSAPLLAFNGARDSQVPIEDLTLLLLHGSIKEAWVNPDGNHVAIGKGGRRVG